MVGTERTLRRAGIVAVMVVVIACFAAAKASAAPLALISNPEVGSVSVVNTQTNAMVGEPIELGGHPKSIAITPDGRFAYVANEESHSVEVIELATRRIVGEPIEIGGQLGPIAVSPDGKTVYVGDSTAKKLVAIDTQTDRVTDTASLGSWATGIAIAPDGKTAYMAEQDAQAVETVDTQSMARIGAPIPLTENPQGVAVAPDGKSVYVADENSGVAVIDPTTRKVSYLSPVPFWAGAITVAPNGKAGWVSGFGEPIVINLQSGALIEELQTGGEMGEVALTPDGERAYLLGRSSSGVKVFDAQTYREIKPQPPTAGGSVAGIAITPDQSPTAAFTVTGITADYTATFDGSASSDPDGTVKHWAWAFGGGASASEVSTNLGVSATGSGAVFTYPGPGTYPVTLTVLDNEGCGTAEVFTGRTAYCSGNPAARVTHPVAVSGPPAPAPVCSKNFAVGGVSHNRKNGTVRLRLRFYSTGSFLLFGKKIHAVTRKVRKPGVAVVTLHARVELNKELKKTLRAGVRYRVTFTPSAGCGSKTVHRSVALLRAPRKKRHR